MKTLQQFLGKVKYDNNGTQIWAVTEKDGHQLIGEVRGWGAIQNIFKHKDHSIDMPAAEAFQDEMGAFIADAINEKIALSFTPKPHISNLAKDEMTCRKIAEICGWKFNVVKESERITQIICNGDISIFIRHEDGAIWALYLREYIQSPSLKIAALILSLYRLEE